MEARAKMFFESFVNGSADNFHSLPQSGSSRVNYVAGYRDKKYIVTENNNLPENESFLYFSRLFSELELPTPKILAVSKERTFYIQEYLGDVTLSERIAKEPQGSHRLKKWVHDTLFSLYTLQVKTQGRVDYARAFEYREYNEVPVLHDLFYFKFLFLDVLDIPYHKYSLIKEFQKLSVLVENLGPKGIMLRDFQSRNIILDSKENIFFIDYQSAMYGPLLYDVISFLFQSRAGFSQEFCDEMLAFYYSLWSDPQTVDSLKCSRSPLQLMRCIQVLGVYGFRGWVQKKNTFIQSIPQSIENFIRLVEYWDEMKNFPEIFSLAEKLSSGKTKEKVNVLSKF
ncbi:MAG: aminoglycoside phosphotransferase family protein [Bergeyella sp.]|nr:aminoglycoside phosphotransferase family protein [Bergeyella sp.]